SCFVMWKLQISTIHAIATVVETWIIHIDPHSSMGWTPTPKRAPTSVTRSRRLHLCFLLCQRLTEGQVVRQRYEFANLVPQARKVLVHVTRKTIGDLARCFGIFINHLLERELRIVKCVNQFAH